LSSPRRNRGEVCATGKHLATYSGGTTYFIHADRLGIERVRTDKYRASYEACTSLAFGDGQSITGTCGDVSPMHFTGKEHDSESGLDNFGAGYDSSSRGRFISPVPVNLTWKRLIQSPPETLLTGYCSRDRIRV